MKISIKTLKGEQFQIDVEQSDLVSQIKQKIEASKSEFPADRQKLIHAGKVLKDEASISETGIAENEFIVCMVTKDAPKKPVVNQTQTTTTIPTGAPPITTPLNTNTNTNTQNLSSATTISGNTATTTPTTQKQYSPEVVKQLMDMGFPESEVHAALRVANGNSGLAVEYLMSGIPESTQQANTVPFGGSSTNIEQLRSHPQFNQLKRLVQSNPAALGQVLEAIGQQNPELLQAIHSNQSEFLNMMNEPITETKPQTGNVTSGVGTAETDSGGDLPNPVQLMAMIQAMPPQLRAQAAQSLGMTPDQLQAMTQMLSSLSPEQLQQLVGDTGRLGGVPPGTAVIRLTTEEMSSVTRLTELGFDQQDAIAAYIACDKNEALAANLLLEGWTAGDGGNDDNINF